MIKSTNFRSSFLKGLSSEGVWSAYATAAPFIHRPKSYALECGELRKTIVQLANPQTNEHDRAVV
jgi:hypothetical protein